MKRLLIFSLAYYPHVGGAEIAIKEITDRIHDIEFCMVTMRFSPEDPLQEKIGNVTMYRVGGGVSYFSKILFVPRAFFLARRLNRTRQFDAAWAMMSYMLFPLVFLRISGLRLPYAVTLQEGDAVGHVFGRWYIKIFLPLLGYGFKHATVVQAISHFLGAWARERGFAGVPLIIPNGVDVTRFAQINPVASTDALKRLSIHANELVLITTSRLVRKNGIDTILRAMPLLGEQTHLVIIGQGQEQASLKKLAQELGVGSRVHFLGYMDSAQLPAYLHAATIFVRPSRSEGMGNSFIEAMAANLPVIATQEGGIADFLFDAKRNPGKDPTGFAVDVDSPEQVAKAVEYIVSNPGETQKVIKNAQKMVLEKYDWELIAKDMRERVFARLFV